MAIRLHEVHPLLVHFPLALLPLAIGADLLGLVTHRRVFRDFGRRSIALAAAGAAASAVTGLVAQEEVNAEGEARDILTTHRNLNALGTLVATGMALWRDRHKPSAAYVAAGIAGIGVLTYTGYLGGKLVYAHGVGIGDKGVARVDAPRLTGGQLRAFLRDIAVDLWHGVKHMGLELAQGKIVPQLQSSPGGR